MVFLLWLFLDVVLSYPSQRHCLDLTHTIREGIPVGPNNPLDINVSYFEKPGVYKIQTEVLLTNVHVGTHTDAPVHFFPGRWSIDQIPEDRLRGLAVLVDVRNMTEKDRNYGATEKDFQDWENANGRIPERSFVLLRTGWERYWNDTEKYLGTLTGNLEEFSHPGFSEAAARWLVKERDILGVGLDTVSLDPGSEFNFPAHKVFLGANLTGFENLANLDQIPSSSIADLYLEVFPLKIENASGAPSQINVCLKT